MSFSKLGGGCSMFSVHMYNYHGIIYLANSMFKWLKFAMRVFFLERQQMVNHEAG